MIFFFYFKQTIAQIPLIDTSELRVLVWKAKQEVIGIYQCRTLVLDMENLTFINTYSDHTLMQQLAMASGVVCTIQQFLPPSHSYQIELEFKPTKLRRNNPSSILLISSQSNSRFVPFLPTTHITKVQQLKYKVAGYNS